MAGHRETILLDNHPFQVIGIYQSTGILRPANKTQVIVPFETARRCYRGHPLMDLTVKPRDGIVRGRHG